MMQSNPLVSIVIPVYNGARYLAEAIDSALAQTYYPCEIVVINDGSTDSGATEAVALAYGNRIRYISKPNGGVASALNRGIKEMKGEFFSWLSHDDAYYPIKIEVQMNEMRCRKAPVILFSDYDIMDKDSRFVQREFLDHVRPSLFRIALIARSPVNGCTCLIPKSCFETVGYFDESLKSTQDNDMWFRLSETIPFIHMRERLIKSRIHPSQGSLVMTTHSDESNAYYARSMKRLLESTPDKMQSIVFARLAVWLKIAGLDKLSSQAIDISKAGLSASFLVPGLWARAVTAYALLCNRRYMWGTLALGFRTRVLRRKVSRCFASAKKGAVRVS